MILASLLISWPTEVRVRNGDGWLWFWQMTRFHLSRGIIFLPMFCIDVNIVICWCRVHIYIRRIESYCDKTRPPHMLPFGSDLKHIYTINAFHVLCRWLSVVTNIASTVELVQCAQNTLRSPPKSEKKVTIFSSTWFFALYGSTHDAEVVYFGHIVKPGIKKVSSSIIMNESLGLQ